MTRFTSFQEGDIVHCIKRGAFGNNIFRDDNDYWRFVRLLYLSNDVYIDTNLCKTDRHQSLFERPPHWPEREPLVDVISWCAMPNHFHILVKEIKVGGIGKFMQRLSGSLTKSFNVRHDNQGSIFQAKYKPVLVENESHLYHLIPYINVKNVMELYPDGGLKGAYNNFDKAWEWSKTYKFSSMRTFTLGTQSPLLAHDSITEIGYPKPEDEFKKQAFECVTANLTKDTGGILTI